MQLKACYAYNKKKYVNIQVSLGEGLTGQAWQERDTIFITDVPDDFIKITSGLGNANPRCILIVPIKSEQEVEGVIELAAFHVLERHEIQFVQELADKLASIVHAVKMQETTNNLLENAQQITEELRAQEEEMRQNMEELQATQEEMHRNSAELNKEVVRLGQNLFLYDKVISKVYEGIIILNEKLEITYANEFVSGILKYDKSELIGEHVNQFINADVEKIVNFLANDPGYIVTGFSEKKEVFLMEKLGDSIKAKMVLTKFMGLDNEASVVFLINTKTEDKSRKRLQLMIGRS